MLSDQFCDEARVPRSTPAIEYINILRSRSDDPLDGLLGSEEGRDAAIASLNIYKDYKVRVVRQLAGIQEKFCTVHIHGESKPTYVALLGDCEQPFYPTDMESLIFFAIIQPNSIIGACWTDFADGRKLDWRTKAKGLAIVAIPLTIKSDVTLAVPAILGLEDCELKSGTVTLGSVAASATNFEIGTTKKNSTRPKRDFCLKQCQHRIQSGDSCHSIDCWRTPI